MRKKVVNADARFYLTIPLGKVRIDGDLAVVDTGLSIREFFWSFCKMMKLEDDKK